MSIVEFINNIYGTSYIEEDLKEVVEFSLLWNIFEGERLNITEILSDLEKRLSLAKLDIKLFEVQLQYFKDRYIVDNSTNELFEKLNFRINSQRKMVKNVLLGNEVDPVKSIMALCIIVYRIRNNFFHGTKKIKDIKQQNQNIEMANTILKIFIERLR